VLAARSSQDGELLVKAYTRAVQKSCPDTRLYLDDHQRAGLINYVAFFRVGVKFF
jgi:hypothetical protein